MENNQEDNSIKNKVLQAIETGKVKMKPKWEFVLQTILMIFGAIILILGLLYFFSLTIFILRQSGLWFVPSFGYKGIMPFFSSLPWLLIILVLVAIMVLEILVKHFSFVYRKPVLYSFAGIVLLVIFGSFSVANSQFHRGMFELAERDHLPFANSLYQGYGLQRLENVAEGVIRETSDLEYVIENRKGESITVIVDDDTDVNTVGQLEIGDVIVVIGQRSNGSINARGIQEIQDFPSMPKRKMMRDRLPLPPGKMK
jgi:hypothetical protein